MNRFNIFKTAAWSRKYLAIFGCLALAACASMADRMMPGCEELVRDGSFEEHPCGKQFGSCGISPAQPGGGSSIGGDNVWVATNGITYQIPNCVHPELYDSPAGYADVTDFVEIGAGFAATLSQNIEKPLKRGTTYKLTFIQSAYAAPGSAVVGKVIVSLVPTSGNGAAATLSQSEFTTAAGARWQ
ncbi:MAG: hypothetical protein JO353_08225, partial [Phycisphaerae bacterium]|nr:hypothetical protein [Phycisphaerae bacterium]